MASKKEQEYSDLIQELQKCKGIGALITAIQSNRNKLDKNFFNILDKQIKDAAEEGNQKLAGSLSYLNRVMDNLQIRQSISKTEEEEEEEDIKEEEEMEDGAEDDDGSEDEEEEEEEEEEQDETSEDEDLEEVMLEIQDEVEKGELVDALMKLVDYVIEERLTMEKAVKKVKEQDFLDLAEKDIIIQINGLCNKIKGQSPPKAHILAHLISEISTKLDDDEIMIISNLTLSSTMNIVGNYEAAIKKSEELLPLLEENNKNQEIGMALGNIGNAYYRLGELKEALNYYNKALENCKKIGDIKQTGAAIGNLGNVYYRFGEFEKAIDHYKKALEISKSIKDRSGEANRLGNMGNAYIEFGELDDAIDSYINALNISKEIKDIRQASTALGNLGNAYYKMGELDDAIDYYNQSLEISRDIKDKRGEGNRLGNLGNAYSELGEFDEAIDYYLESLNISKQVKDKRQASSTLGNLANTYYKLGDIDEAIDYYNQAIEVSKEIKDIKKENIWHYNLGILYEDSKKDYDKAYEHYISSVDLLDKMLGKIKNKNQYKSFQDLNIDMYGRLVLLSLKMEKDDDAKKHIKKVSSNSLNIALNNKYEELKKKDSLPQDLKNVMEKLPKFIKV